MKFKSSFTFVCFLLLFESATADALTEYERGVRALCDGEYEQALVHLEKAFKVKSSSEPNHPRIGPGGKKTTVPYYPALFLGICHYALGHFQEAFGLYQYLKSENRNLESENIIGADKSTIPEERYAMMARVFAGKGIPAGRQWNVQFSWQYGVIQTTFASLPRPAPVQETPLPEQDTAAAPAVGPPGQTLQVNAPQIQPPLVETSLSSSPQDKPNGAPPSQEPVVPISAPASEPAPVPATQSAENPASPDGKPPDLFNDPVAIKDRLEKIRERIRFLKDNVPGSTDPEALSQRITRLEEAEAILVDRLKTLGTNNSRPMDSSTNASVPTELPPNDAGKAPADESKDQPELAPVAEPSIHAPSSDQNPSKSAKVTVTTQQNFTIELPEEMPSYGGRGHCSYRIEFKSSGKVKKITTLTLIYPDGVTTGDDKFKAKLQKAIEKAIKETVDREIEELRFIRNALFQWDQFNF